MHAYRLKSCENEFCLIYLVQLKCTLIQITFKFGKRMGLGGEVHGVKILPALIFLLGSNIYNKHAKCSVLICFKLAIEYSDLSI